MVNFFFLFFSNTWDFSENRPEFPLFLELSQIYKNLRKHLKTLLIFQFSTSILGLLVHNPIKHTTQSCKIYTHIHLFTSIIKIYTYIHIYMTKYSTYQICKIFIQCSNRRRLLDGSTHFAGGYSTGAPFSGPENVFETYGKE